MESMDPYLVIQRSVCQATMFSHSPPIHRRVTSGNHPHMSEDSIGKRIAAARKRKGLTQERLARELDSSAQTVSRWERDAFAPDETFLPKLAALLDVTPAWVEYGVAPSATPAESSAVELDSDPVVEAVIAEEDCTPDEAAALRSANWKLVAGANYGPDFIRRVLLARRRPSAAVETTLPDGVARLPAKRLR